MLFWKEGRLDWLYRRREMKEVAWSCSKTNLAPLRTGIVKEEKSVWEYISSSSWLI